MDKQISDGTMLGIVLIALAVIIALGFGIFAIAKGTANEGVTKVQTNLANVQASEFTDYDQTVVTGTRAKAAISDFEGKPVAIIIATSAWLDLEDSKGEWNSVSEEYRKPDGIPLGEAGTGINYNAMLGEGDSADNVDAGELTLENGKYQTEGGFAVANGAILFQNNIASMNRSGMTEFINPMAKFSANLIVDRSGTTMGIVFKQIGGANGS